MILLLHCFLSMQVRAQCPDLLWSDEFDTNTLDLDKWSFQEGDGCDIALCGWGNNELQYYQTDNVEVSDGVLKIIAKEETVENSSYTSARIRTINKSDIRFGRIEARMKLPIGKGIWPAFWMLPTDMTYGVWPKSGEIDIMEYLGHEPATIHGTLHYGNPWPNNASTTNSFTLSEGTFHDQFHIYALEWTNNNIKWFIDGYLYSTKTKSDLGGFQWPYDQDFHILLNLAVGGNWPGNPDATTGFPQVFEIDYVRVYDMVGDPYLKGPQKVPFQAQQISYSIENLRPGSNVSWTVPGSAQVVGEPDTNRLLLNWGEEGGEITATILNDCDTIEYSLIVEVELPYSTELILENFDQESRITRTFQTGEFFDEVDNPAPDSINDSPLCGKYQRDASEQFDVLTYEIEDINNAADFITETRQFYIDIWTEAPPGTNILLQLENSNQANPANYPVGRHSRYTAVTSKQNQWERLKFSYLDQPDQNVSNSAVNQLIFLFASNSNDASSYYIDNFEIYAQSNPVSLNEDKEASQLLVSPNPTMDFLEIRVEESQRISFIEIFDRKGGKVLSQQQVNSSDIRLNIDSLVPGVYFLQATFSDAEVRSASFIKQ